MSEKQTSPISLTTPDIEGLRENLFGKNKKECPHLHEWASNIWLFYVLAMRKFFPNIRAPMDMIQFPALSMFVICAPDKMSKNNRAYLEEMQRSVSAKDLQNFMDFLHKNDGIAA